ncbi:hypothetical protein ACNKHM_01860 [Shigella sonnei]
MVLSDAMMGYLHFIAHLPRHSPAHPSKRCALSTPPLSVINQWQLAPERAHLAMFVVGLAPQHPQYAVMHESSPALPAATPNRGPN